MGIKAEISNHHRIMLDSAPVIYFIEENSIFGAIADEIFLIIKENSYIHAFSSAITLVEVLTQPFRQSDNELVRTYKKFLLESVNFTIYSLDPEIAELAAKLRADYGIRTPDAIQLATGIKNSGSLFITNDKRLKKIKEIEVMVLEDYL